MNSDSELMPLDEDYILCMEAAEKLDVIYVKEGQIFFTDSFMHTITMIKEDDYFWNYYLEEIYRGERSPGLRTPGINPLDEPLKYMAHALLEVHLEPVELDYEIEDWLKTVEMVQKILQMYWNGVMTKGIRDRNMWLTMLSGSFPWKISEKGYSLSV